MMWGQRIWNWLKLVPSSLFVGFAVILMIIDIIGDHWDYADPIQDGDSSDIKEYVLFSKHQYKSYEVVTGIQFASSRERDVEKQWCYISKVGNIAASDQTITIATAESTNPPNMNTYDNRVLASFDPTRQTLEKFVKSHCRFR